MPTCIQLLVGNSLFKPLPMKLLESQMLPVHRQPDINGFPLRGRPHSLLLPKKETRTQQAEEAGILLEHNLSAEDLN